MKSFGKPFAVALAAMMICGGLIVISNTFGNDNDKISTSDWIALGTIPPGAIPVSNAADLALVGSTGATGAFPLNGYYYLTNNIILTGVDNHVPIGTSAPFTGVFNGGGHTISGLNISVYNGFTGLFASIQGGYVVDLNLNNGSISTFSATGLYIGSIAGSITNSYIIGCSSSISISGGSNTLSSSIGGIVGRATDSYVINCYNTGSVELLNARPALYVGGIAGNINGTTVTSCYNTGPISTKVTLGAASQHANYVGGVVGHSSTTRTSTISDCYNTGSVTSISTVSTLETPTPITAVAGGILGHTDGSSTASNNVRIINCYNIGTVSVSSGGGTSDSVLGAILGRIALNAASPQIINCYSVSNSYFKNGGAVTVSISNGGNPTIDGVSIPDRTVNQGSGIRASSLMQTSLANAQAGTSIYFTGTTAGNIQGWNFNTVWNIGGSSGYPALRMSPPDIAIPVPILPIEITSTPNTNISAGETWRYTPVTTVLGAAITVNSGPSGMTSDGSTVLFPVPTPAGGPYDVTITATYPNYLSATQTFTLTEITDTSPPIATISIQEVNRNTFTITGGSVANNHTSITIFSGDGRSSNGESITWTYNTSGRFTPVVYVSNAYDNDTADEYLMVVDLSPALMAWTTVEYRFAPDILPDITPTFTLTDPSGFPSTWLSWDDTLRCVIGTPGTGEANKTYKATLQYGSEPITWDIDVRTVSTVVPTAGIGCDIDGLNLKLTAISNTPEMMAAHDWKIYSVSTSALVASSTARNPVLAVPAAGLYEITLKITNSNGTAPATRTLIIPEPEPEPEEEEELLKIAAIIVIVIGVILLLIAGAAMSGWGAAAGIVLVGAGLLLYFFVDLSAVDAWILKFFGDRLR